MAQAYLNGDWVDDARLAVPIADVGFAMGVTVTERLRTFNGAPWRQAEHARRLRRSLEIVGMDVSLADEIDNAISEFIARNRSLFGQGDDWTVVAFATPGAGEGPTRCVHGFPLPFGSWVHQYRQGVALRVSSVRQTPANCWPPELKCRSRMHYYLADQQAQREEPGAKALLLDQQGYVGEASTANVLVYRKEEGLVSPPLEKVLPGVTVEVVREIATRLGIAFVERNLTPDEFKSADEALLCSTSSCTLPVVRCDGQPIENGQPGDVYRAILNGWNELTGVKIVEQAQTFSMR